MNRLKPLDLIIGISALLLISVSFWQTWLGLQQIFGPASIVISLVLSVMLLILSWLMREEKLKDNSVTPLFFMYIFIASFCFMANFNSLYTRFMKTDIYSNELRGINEDFNQLESDVNSKFNYIHSGEFLQNIEIKKAQMIEQIKDPGNPGIGERAKSLIRDLEKLLGQRVDILTCIGNDYVDLADRMGSQIDAMITSLSPVETDLKVDINKAVLKWNKKIQELLLLTNAQKDDISQSLIDESLTEYNKLGNRAINVLGANKFKFESKLSKTQEVGKIGYAFEHAIKNFSVFQVVVLMGCILLDFLLPILIILITKPNDKGSRNTGFRRQGRVLIPKN